MNLILEDLAVEREAVKMRVDRLSSLPDDVLILIISLHPLQLAIATGTLSRRWRGLWFNTTSIDITFRETSKLSLVSIELGSKSGSFMRKDWQFPEDCDNINLPNLKNLTVHFGPNYQCISKLVKACPSLEQLSLNCWPHHIYGPLRSHTFVINAPNLEYLAISAPKYMTFSFEDNPIVLREAKIEFTDLPQVRLDKDKLSRLYKAVSNVRIFYS
ncbi:F-box protein At5g03100-like [Silene latifolia]|uniref:F-box protein At5g03100-like n=1 Tax=Silene latifolia TaxID=37657 RepID=UPI003D7789C4